MSSPICTPWPGTTGWNPEPAAIKPHAALSRQASPLPQRKAVLFEVDATEWAHVEQRGSPHGTRHGLRLEDIAVSGQAGTAHWRSSKTLSVGATGFADTRIGR